MSTEIIDRAAFETWLKEQAPTAIVGHANTHYHCPLGMYVRVGMKRGWTSITPSTGKQGGGLHLDGKFQLLPTWANTFALRVDDCVLSGEKFSDVTAAHALEILQSVPT